MNIIGDVFKELYSMFMADAALSGAILALVAAIAAVDGLGLDHRIGGAALIAGCLAIIVVVTAREARRRGGG